LGDARAKALLSYYDLGGLRVLRRMNKSTGISAADVERAINMALSEKLKLTSLHLTDALQRRPERFGDYGIPLAELTTTPRPHLVL